MQEEISNRPIKLNHFLYDIDHFLLDIHHPDNEDLKTKLQNLNIELPAPIGNIFCCRSVACNFQLGIRTHKEHVVDLFNRYNPSFLDDYDFEFQQDFRKLKKQIEHIAHSAADQLSYLASCITQSSPDKQSEYTKDDLLRDTMIHKGSSTRDMIWESNVVEYLKQIKLLIHKYML